MTVFRSTALLPLLLSLSSCALKTLPEPDEFTLSAAQLRRTYPSSRTLGTVTLHGRTIHSSQDKRGRPYHLASGGALLVKNSTPKIIAKAPSILLTPDHAQIRGRSVVKKNNQLHLGDSDRTTITIDGVRLTTEGPVSVRQVAAREIKTPTKKPAATPVPRPISQKPAAPVKTTPPQAAPVKKEAAKPAPQPPQATTVKARTPAPAAKTPPTAQAPQPQPSTPKAAKPAPAKVDRAKLLNMMREPGDN